MKKYNLNTIRKDLKIVYSENGAISLVFQNNNILKGVVGEFDSNLKELEGKKIEGLVENKLKNQNRFFGRTRKMTPVIFESTSCNPGDLVQVDIISSNQNNLFGKHMVNKYKAA